MMIEETFINICGLIGVIMTFVFLVVTLTIIVRNLITYIKQYICWKNMKVGDVYEFQGIANVENPFERIPYTLRVTIFDIREGWIRYNFEYIPYNDSKSMSSFIRNEHWRYVMKIRTLLDYKKIKNNTKF